MIIIVRDRRAAFISIAGGAFTSLTVPLVQTLLPVGSSVFAATSRVYSYWTFATIVAGNAFQGFVNEDGRAGVRRKFRLVVVWFAIQGAVLGAALMVLGGHVVGLIFGEGLLLPHYAFILLGISYFLVSISTAAGRLFLVPFGKAGWVTVGTVTAALTGAVLLLALVPREGLSGAYWAVLVAESYFACFIFVAAGIEMKRSGPVTS
jgi:hypothetical protein